MTVYSSARRLYLPHPRLPPGCEALDEEALHLQEGEAFHFEPYGLEGGAPGGGAPGDRFTWSRRRGANGTERIGSDEDERVHHHGGALFFLRPLRGDSGLYTARQRSPSGRCFDHRANVSVGPAAGGRVLYPADEGVYTCVCTWTHNHTQYTTSASRRLELEAVSAHRDVMILAPADKEKFADEGSALQLKCSVFCGTNVRSACEASWRVDGAAPHRLAGYEETTETVNLRPSNSTISTALLSILSVSPHHFTASFQCRGRGRFHWDAVSLRLKQRGTMIPLSVGGVCVSLLCGRLFDAYVVYQRQSPDTVSEDALAQFVARVLPSVLEDRCGYRLFIHGRDAIPGEDRLELVEDRMKQSRRLMVILPPGSGSESESSDQQSGAPQSPEIGGVDWQVVGLHHVLLQGELSVILIQLGDPGPRGYTHLPAGLQHLILKSAPLRWSEGLRGATTWNSHFWKRVRYLMPATPAKRCSQPAII
ncbi:Interleukin-1 receptor type 1 [Liparis tanakae]|uniref:Interleukin-1 receptor type 1 n=1 Tax=Liparis tanakae TaxID=230148 RepID=A0A4Z2EQ68_9TELE|nr:Interleukin-1 receptor type 1 [Liparis tanakae]